MHSSSDVTSGLARSKAQSALEFREDRCFLNLLHSNSLSLCFALFSLSLSLARFLSPPFSLSPSLSLSLSISLYLFSSFSLSLCLSDSLSLSLCLCVCLPPSFCLVWLCLSTFEAILISERVCLSEGLSACLHLFPDYLSGLFLLCLRVFS